MASIQVQTRGGVPIFVDCRFGQIFSSTKGNYSAQTKETVQLNQRNCSAQPKETVQLNQGKQCSAQTKD